MIYESIPERIRPIGRDQEQGEKTRSIKIYKKWDWKKRSLETERGGGKLLAKLSTSFGKND